ncbi:MAG: hypothetical protein K2V38_26905, partial [Gemmataceae bacterium]|nr:hypothetical protein [Gemmataceae bacterium]
YEAGATNEQVRNLFKNGLRGLGLTVQAEGTTELNISGTPTSALKKVIAYNNEGAYGVAPKLVGTTQGDSGRPEYTSTPGM